MRRFCIALGCIAVIWVWFFYFNVSATDNSAYDTQMELKRQYQTDYLNLVGEYENGYISYDEFKARADEITERYNEVNTDENGVLNDIAKKTTETVNSVTEGIGNAIGTVGESVKDWIEDVFNDNKATENVSTTDYKGYGAVALGYYKAYEAVIKRYYADYITVAANGKNFFPHSESGVYICENYDRNGNYEDTTEYNSGKNIPISDSYIWTFYGDVRYEDGTQYPTNDEYVEQPTYDFSDNTDSELDDLLNELLEELNRQAPDLSSIEGLLESIYYRLGSLDSDDDNALLSQVLVAIQSLENNNDNSDLLTILEEIRDKLSDSGSDEPLDSTDFQNQIIQYISLGEVSEYEEFAINVRGLFYSKFSFISEFQSFFSSLSWGSPESIVIDFSFMDNSYTIDTSVYNELMPTFRGMLAFFVYGVFCIRCFKRMPTIISGGGDE